MPFLYSFLSLFIVAAAFYGVLLLRKWKKKESFKDKVSYIELAIDLGIGFAVGLLIALILVLFSGGIGLWSGLVLFSCIEIIPCLFKPHKFFHHEEEKKKIDVRKAVFAGFLGLGILLDLFVLNNKSFQNYGTYTEVAPSSFVQTNGSQEPNGVYFDKTGYITVNVPEGGATNVRFNIEAPANTYIRVTTSYSTDGTNFASFESKDMDGQNVDFHLVAVPGYTNIQKYRFDFAFSGVNHYGENRSFLVRSLSFNVKPRVNFSLLRYGLYAAIVSAVFISPVLIEKLKKTHEVNKVPYLVLGGVTVAAVVVAVIAAFANKETMFTPYPIAQDQLAKMDTDIFTQLFDAFRKGQVSLDIEPDPRLLSMPNPYDGAARSSLGVKYLWDHAFYGGKYYCYYGAVPVLLISFPLYWLSGGTLVPNAFCLEVIGMALLIPAFLFLLLEIYRFVCKKVSWPGYAFLGFIGLITTMMISAITFKDGYYHEAIYHVPDIYGLLFFDLFLAFVLRAYRKTERRALELSLSGLAYVLVIASRPNLFIGVIIAVPFYVGMLLRKQCTWKQKLVQFGSMGAILLVGAVALCVYNKVRFDSILEFGQSYQLTVADQTNLTYSGNKFYPSLLHFFFQGPANYDRFPYISCSIVRYSFDDCPYVQSYYGALRIPLFWGAVALPLIFWKGSNAETRTFSFMFPVFAVFFAFTTYSKAGICPRYLIELYHIMTIAGIFALLKMSTLLKETKGYQPLVYVGSGIAIFSAFQCLCLSFDTFDGMNTGDMGGFFLLVKSIFQSFNF